MPRILPRADHRAEAAHKARQLVTDLPVAGLLATVHLAVEERRAVGPPAATPRVEADHQGVDTPAVAVVVHPMVAAAGPAAAAVDRTSRTQTRRPDGLKTPTNYGLRSYSFLMKL